MKYKLRCYFCGVEFDDRGFSLSCPNGCDSLVYTKYSSKFNPSGDGLKRYSFWLPFEVDGPLPAVIRSEEFSEISGADIYFTIYAYWPEMGVRIKTCSFKEVEALSSLKYSENFAEGITLASVGNTANAFIEHAKNFDVKVYLFVPERVFDDVFEIERSENVTLIKVRGSYDFAQHLARKFAEIRGYSYEGGGRNFARRDALASTCYTFFETFKRMPDFYVQPVGSGTGAIAFYEGYKRLASEFNLKRPKVVVVQNEPFTPIVDAWKERKKDVGEYEDPLDRIYAKVLSNRSPLYGVKGGLYDVLSESGGDAISVNEKEAKDVGKIFKKVYGISLHPAAEVGLAGLMKMKVKGTVLCNVTGAGFDRLKKDYKVRRAREDYVVESEEDLEMVE